MFYQILFALQVKRRPIIPDKHEMSELPHELTKRIKT